MDGNIPDCAEDEFNIKIQGRGKPSTAGAVEVSVGEE
jgi:hypothetical protein